jgi:hypothetical protein
MTPQLDDAAAKREFKGFRIDLIIAVCALLVSSMATAAAWWQSRVVAQQLASQVWPYLSLQSSYDRKSLSFTMANEGLGPARVRSIVMTVDGVPHHYLTDALRVLMPGQRPAPHGTFSDVQRGSVIRVGGTVTLFRIFDPPIIEALVRGSHRIGVRACYCAIVPGSCWFVTRTGAGNDNGDPVPVGECPDVGAVMYESGVAP